MSFKEDMWGYLGNVGNSTGDLLSKGATGIMNGLGAQNQSGSGWLSNGLGAGASLFGAWNGYQQMQAGKQQLQHNQALDKTNLQNQATLTNDMLRYREQMRQANSGNPVNSQASMAAVNAYMDRNKVRGNL